MQKHAFVLKEGLKSRIRDFIQPIQSPKRIFAHPDLISLFNFAYQFKFNELLRQGDSLVQFQEIEEAQDKTNAVTLVFILHPIPSAMATIKSILVRNEAKLIKKSYSICFVPKIDVLSVQELQRLSIRNKVNVTNFDFGLIPFPNNLHSLELSPHCHKVDFINSCVQGLLLFFRASGQVKRIVGKGQKSQIILKQLDKMLQIEDLFLTQNEKQDAFLVVMDRSIDLVTPMLTGHSYEALIDHFYGINLGNITIPQSLLGKEGNQVQDYRLYNRDKIYDQLAHNDIGFNYQKLQKGRAELGEKIKEKRKQAKTPQQFKELTSVWGVKYEQANNHLSITNSIFQPMKNKMYFGNLANIQMDLVQKGSVSFDDLHCLSLYYPSEHLLRLTCLFSQVYPLPTFYNKFQRDLLQLLVYGYEENKHIYNMFLLQKMGLIKNSKVKNKWSQICQAFDLIPSDPHSYTKVFIRYSALSVRFVQMLIKGRLSAEANALLGRQNNYLKGLQGEGKKIKQLYVFYVGGVTYGQISCLRILQRELGIKIVVLTTKVLSAVQLISHSIVESAL